MHVVDHLHLYIFLFNIIMYIYMYILICQIKLGPYILFFFGIVAWMFLELDVGRTRAT